MSVVLRDAYGLIVSTASRAAAAAEPSRQAMGSPVIGHDA
jgi:hypothetical protein